MEVGQQADSVQQEAAPLDLPLHIIINRDHFAEFQEPDLGCTGPLDADVKAGRVALGPRMGGHQELQGAGQASEHRAVYERPAERILSWQTM